MVQIIIQRSALQQEQSEYFIRKKPNFYASPSVIAPIGMVDDYIYDDGSAFYSSAQRNQGNGNDEDAEIDEETEMEEARLALEKADNFWK